jgi:catechol 2,3-dioxygenase-like lactoylglutathione lyase family enzyme
MTAHKETLMSVSADHFVALVHDIEKASADYETLGFTVQSRADSKPGHGAHYRFVVLEDGSYILLTQFLSEEVIATHRLGPDLAEGEGVADYSFVVPSVANTAAALAAASGKTRGPVDVSNVLVDGSEWGLKLLMTGKGTQGDDALPFVVEDTVGREFRIPSFKPHANGITRLAGLKITALDALKTATSLGLILQAPVEADGESLRIAAPFAPIEVLADNGMPRVGRSRGGVHEIIVKGSDTGLMDPALTHGVRLQVVK